MDAEVKIPRGATFDAELIVTRDRGPVLIAVTSWFEHGVLKFRITQTPIR